MKRLAVLQAKVAADLALMALLFAMIGVGKPFSVEALMIAAEAEREAGSSILADTIRAAVGRGDQSVRLGIWLAARQSDPLDGIGVKKVGETADHAGLYELVRV